MLQWFPPKPCEAQPLQPIFHRLSPHVCYHSLDNTAAVLVPTLSAETRSRLPQALRHASQKRQREFLAGRWCAEQALQRLGAGSTHVAMADEATLFQAADGCSFCEFCTFVLSAKESCLHVYFSAHAKISRVLRCADNIVRLVSKAFHMDDYQ